MATSRGKVFETELKSSIEHKGVMIERIPDKLFWNGKRLLSQQTKADFIAYVAQDRVIPLMIEAKATAEKRISFSALQDHQEEALIAFEAYHEDMLAFVAVNFYDSTNIRRMNRCFMVPISVWMEYKAGTRKSIPMADMDSDGRIIECKRISGSIYDMDPWLGSIRER